MRHVAFKIGSLQADRPIQNAQAAYVGVEADFTVEVDGEVVYSETRFPVVELAASLRGWLKDADDEDSGDFEWDSMSTPERGWVWIRRTAGWWRVGSIHQDRAVVDTWSSTQIASAIDAFCSAVVAQGSSDLNVDLSPWIG